MKDLVAFLRLLRCRLFGHDWKIRPAHFKFRGEAMEIEGYYCARCHEFPER